MTSFFVLIIWGDSITPFPAALAFFSGFVLVFSAVDNMT